MIVAGDLISRSVLLHQLEVSKAVFKELDVENGPLASVVNEITDTISNFIAQMPAVACETCKYQARTWSGWMADYCSNCFCGSQYESKTSV